VTGVYEDRFYWSADSLRLHARDYAGPPNSSAIPVLCLHGLTRNARDFAALADRLQAGRRVVCANLRGRGDSAYAKDPLTYMPLTYVQDIQQLVGTLGLTRFVVIGTSLGGILAMLMAGVMKERLAGVVLNDIGPAIDAAGLARIRSYVGSVGPYPTWMHAARAVEDIARSAHPAYGLDDWVAMAKRLCRLEPSGRILFDYDPRIAEPFKLPGGDAGVDLWPGFEALRGIPVLSVRGSLSDLFSAATQADMARRMPTLDTITIPGTGHAPTLSEPKALKAIDALLARADRQDAASVSMANS
jgi:pimeloyl-ACP methyl ester carboxylesterase